MAKITCVQCRVDPATKLAFRLFAETQGTTESALLQRWVNAAARSINFEEPSLGQPIECPGKSARVYVRLRPDDLVLMRGRAAARGMATATYVSMLVRVHLRGFPPLPDREFAALKRCVAELAMVGRNLNQIARVANQRGRIEGLSMPDLRTMLRLLEALRDHFKGLINANIKSWETGHEEAPR